MVSYTEQKPRTATRTETDFVRAESGVPRPEVRISQSNTGSNSTIAYVIAAIVLAVGAYFLISNWAPTTVEQPVTENKISLPAPAATPQAPTAVTPGSTTPPAVEKIAPVTPDTAKPAQ